MKQQAPRLEHITPERAAKLLEANTDNRDIRPKRVKHFVGILERGEWIITHQGIGIDTRGRMFDGQHRLWAIIESGIAADIWVSEGVDPRAYEVTDLQEKRRMHDLVHIPRSVLTPISFLIRLNSGMGAFTIEQAKPYINLFLPYAEEVARMISMRIRVFSSASVAAAATFQLFDGNDPDHVRTTMHALIIADFDSMTTTAKSFYRQCYADIRKRTANDLFVRALKVFDDEKTGLTKLQVRTENESSAIAYVVERMNEELTHGVPFIEVLDGKTSVQSRHGGSSGSERKSGGSASRTSNTRPPSHVGSH